jgi:hypothetical protein
MICASQQKMISTSYDLKKVPGEHPDTIHNIFLDSILWQPAWPGNSRSILQSRETDLSYPARVPG